MVAKRQQHNRCRMMMQAMQNFPGSVASHFIPGYFYIETLVGTL
jgi:hypothetical protein